MELARLLIRISVTKEKEVKVKYYDGTEVEGIVERVFLEVAGSVSMLCGCKFLDTKNQF